MAIFGLLFSRVLSILLGIPQLLILISRIAQTFATAARCSSGVFSFLSISAFFSVVVIIAVAWRRVYVCVRGVERARHRNSVHVPVEVPWIVVRRLLWVLLRMHQLS